VQESNDADVPEFELPGENDAPPMASFPTPEVEVSGKVAKPKAPRTYMSAARSARPAETGIHIDDAPKHGEQQPPLQLTSDPVEEESRMVTAARAALLRGDAATAYALVEQARVRYPRGLLVQERQILSIEALAGLGRSEEASSRAERFLALQPSSPYADRARAVLHPRR
jgi:hypothetical protein